MKFLKSCTVLCIHIHVDKNIIFTYIQWCIASFSNAISIAKILEVHSYVYVYVYVYGYGYGYGYGYAYAYAYVYAYVYVYAYAYVYVYVYSDKEE